MLVAVMLPSLLCVPITLMREPTVTALASALWWFFVYVVLAVVVIVTLLLSAAFATMVEPLMLETVSVMHCPCPPGPGVPANVCCAWSGWNDAALDVPKSLTRRDRWGRIGWEK